LLFPCSNQASHPADVGIGVAILTNSFNRPRVFGTMGGRECSYCGSYFDFAGQETALMPYLQHDVDRMQAAGYLVMKDEEVFYEEEYWA